MKKIRIILFLIVLLSIVLTTAISEEYEEAYIICMPNDRVNVRLGPSRASTSMGWCEAGDTIYLDGRKRNGYLHCVDLSIEASEGWIHSGYIVKEKPEYVNQAATITSKSRLAARKYINGKRTRWLKPGAQLKVYYWTETWALTNCGYVQSKYLDLDGI